MALEHFRNWWGFFLFFKTHFTYLKTSLKVALQQSQQNGSWVLLKMYFSLSSIPCNLLFHGGYVDRGYLGAKTFFPPRFVTRYQSIYKTDNLRETFWSPLMSVDLGRSVSWERTNSVGEFSELGASRGAWWPYWNLQTCRFNILCKTLLSVPFSKRSILQLISFMQKSHFSFKF